MDDNSSTLRSGRRWRRCPPPRPRVPTQPEASNVREQPSPLFPCGVCLSTASNPVVTPCGHLFCWPCLYRWLCTRRRPVRCCPVCRSVVAVEPGDAAGVTPIYGVSDGGSGDGGGEERDDDDDALKVPPRPPGWQQTSEAEELRQVRECLRDLSRDVDALEERMDRVMMMVAQLRVPALFAAFLEENARRNGILGAPAAENGRRTRRRVLTGMGSNSANDGVDGVYMGTRSRRRQANL